MLESMRANRPQLSSYIISEQVTGLAVLKPEGASPRHAAPSVRSVGREGGQITVGLACVDERDFVHQLLVVGGEVVKGPAHLLSAIVRSCRTLWLCGLGHTRPRVSRLETPQKLKMRERMSSGRRGGR